MNAGTLRRRAGPGVFFLLALITATIGLARAEDCRAFEDKQRVLAFGRFELGDDPSRLPPDIDKQGCWKDAATGAYDCRYLDADGVSYLLYDHEVIRKDIEDLTKYSGPPLIAGIQANDSLATVLRKFRDLPDGFPDWQVSAGAGEDDYNIYLSLAGCLVTTGGIIWYYDLTFSQDGRLTGITTMFESPI